MTDLHEPEAEFLSHLEWQTRTRLRRARRFDKAPARGRPALLRTAVLIAVSLICGAAGVVAAEQIDRSRQKKLLIERTQIEWDLARARLESAEIACDKVRALHAQGLVSSTELAGEERGLRTVRLEKALLERDLAEIELSGRAPRRDLAAPLVSGRDFVSERLELRREAEAARTDELRKNYARMQTLADSLQINRSEMDKPMVELRESRLQITALRRSLELRQAFLRGAIAAERVDLQARRESRAAHLELIRLRQQQATRRLKRMTRLHERGLADTGTLRKAEFEVRQADAALRVAEIEIGLLDEKLQ